MTSHYLRYSLYSFWRLQILATLSVFAIGAVFLDLSAITGVASQDGQRPPALFAAFFTFGVLWLTYWFGFRIVYWLEVRNGRMKWKTPLRSGSVDVTEIRSVGTWKLLSGIGSIKTTNGRIVVFPTQYLPTLGDRMQQLFPSIEVNVGRIARVSARIKGAVPQPSKRYSMSFEEGDD